MELSGESAIPPAQGSFFEPSPPWVNAAGILLSLKHSWAARQARSAPGYTYGTLGPQASHHRLADPVDYYPFNYMCFPVTQNPLGNVPLPLDTAPNVTAKEEWKERVFEEKDKSSMCHVCNRVYARPSTLRTHMRTHTGEKPYRCAICNKSFSQDANLTAHLRIHSGEKPFQCPVCKRRFAQSSSVTTHMRTHSGERPYQCRVCRRGFADSSTLTKHVRVHTGEKPYCCKVCGTRFSQSGNLSRHMRVHRK